MKTKLLIPLSAIVMLLTACPEPEYKSALSEIHKNNMDFPNLRTRYYLGIRYQLSDFFEKSFYDDFVIKNTADVFIIRELDLYFSIESFTTREAQLAQEDFEGEISNLRAIHDMYAGTRTGTLDNPRVSILKEVPESVKYPGLIQVISDDEIQKGVTTSYFMATLEIDGTYYVIQLIGKKDNMGYLHDDFIDLLSSVSV